MKCTCQCNGMALIGAQVAESRRGLEIVHYLLEPSDTSSNRHSTNPAAQ